MAKQAFGNTWWSAQWLNALTNIDYDNRLPRGRTYANKGAVTGLHIDQGAIQAKVQGSRARPYQITIGVPALSAASIVTLIKTVAQDPIIIARLLNRALDPALLEKATSLGISLFPKRWQDLTMSCSCPDWAVPCKHLAAVIYLVSKEIDSNPFLVFSLRGVDLVQVLKAQDIHIEKEAEACLPQVSDCWRKAAPLPKRAAKKPSLLTSSLPLPTASISSPSISNPPLATLGIAEPLDFSTIPPLLMTIVQILSPNPHFYAQGDFRVILQSTLERVSRAAKKALLNVGPRLNTAASASISAAARPLVILSKDASPSIMGVDGIADIPALIAALSGLEEGQLFDLQPEVAALYYVRLTALHLLAQGAVIPQLFAGKEHPVEIRWFPASLDQRVQLLLQNLSNRIPPSLVLWQEGKTRTPLIPADQASCLCSLFLDRLIHLWSLSEYSYEKTQHLFFSKGTANYTGAGERSTANGIQVWLARLHLSHKEHLPVLCLDEGSASDFTLSLAIENRAIVLEKPTPLRDVLSLPSWKNERFGILQTIALLAEFFVPLNGYVSQGAHTPLRLETNDLPSLLLDTLPLLRFLGIRMLLPKALENLLRPRLSMQIKGAAVATDAFLKAEDIFSFDWKVAIGNHLLSRKEFEALLKSATSLVLFNGEYVYLDARAIEQLHTQLAKPPVLSGTELLRVALAGEYAGAAIGLDKTALSLIKQLTDIKDIALPKGLRATLRPYQRRGYAWLYRNAHSGLGSVIADDMGLGKTVQVIATILKLKEEKALDDAKTLVIVPTTLLTNWQKELQRFAPSLTVGIFHGAKRELAAERPDVLLTTLGVIRKAAASLNLLPWALVIVDEAQQIKNAGTAQTKAAKAIPARSFIAMSGTPVENRLTDYWSIMDFANPGFLGNLTQFVRDYAKPIQNTGDQAIVTRLKKVTAPFLLRRLKSDKSIINDLPDKIEQDQFCSLSDTQAALYQSIVDAGLSTIAGESNAFKRQGLVLQMILALKQICNHPANYLKQGGDDALASGKVERLFDLLDEIYSNHEKVLLFTQFREMGELLRVWLHTRYGREPLFLHGGVSRAQRDSMVERFQEDRTERIFILSLKAGGTGLNLTAAANVIHFDLWWNPAVEAQATDRAYRIGQQKNVQVHRFITRATFEERINDMIQHKKALADLTVGTGEQWIGQLSSQELKELFIYSPD